MEVGLRQNKRFILGVVLGLLVIIAVGAGIWFGFVKNSTANSTPVEAAQTLVKALMNGDQSTITHINYTSTHEQELKQKFLAKFFDDTFSDLHFKVDTNDPKLVEVKSKKEGTLDLHFYKMNGRFYLNYFIFH